MNDVLQVKFQRQNTELFFATSYNLFFYCFGERKEIVPTWITIRQSEENYSTEEEYSTRCRQHEYNRSKSAAQQRARKLLISKCQRDCITVGALIILNFSIKKKTRKIKKYYSLDQNCIWISM